MLIYVDYSVTSFISIASIFHRLSFVSSLDIAHFAPHIPASFCWRKCSHEKEDFDGKADEIVSYNEVIEHLASQFEHEAGAIEDEREGLWRFRDIILHQGPISPKHKDYKGSKWNQ